MGDVGRRGWRIGCGGGRSVGGLRGSTNRDRSSASRPSRAWSGTGDPDGDRAGGGAAAEGAGPRGRRPPDGTAAHRAANPRTAAHAEVRGRLGTPASGRHRGPQGRESAYRRSRTSAGTAWNAGLRTAPRPDRAAKPRTAAHAQVRGRLGTPASGRHRGPQGRETRFVRVSDGAPRARPRQSPRASSRSRSVGLRLPAGPNSFPRAPG